MRGKFLIGKKWKKLLMIVRGKLVQLTKGKKEKKISSFLKLRLQLNFNCRIQDPLSP